MNTDRKPDDFDWVTARSKCSVAAVFERLKLLMADDAEKRNGLRERGEAIFSVIEGGSTRFSVIAKMDHVGHKSVSFVSGVDEIAVSMEGNQLFKATVTLSNDGNCRVLIDGKEHDLWQVRKMALETLFFKRYEEV
jgi:hypothetical protein